MKLTTFTDYSLRVLVYLAAYGRRSTIAEIARAYDISENHLVKIVHFLGRSGWLANVRGKGGGLELALPPEGISIGRVVRQCQGVAAMAECFGDDAHDCAISGCCRLQGVLAEAVAAFYGVLDRCTLADLVEDRERIASILFVPRPAEAGAAP